MSEYGVTEKGFVLKRMDTIIEEIHGDLSEGFKVDTALDDSSFLNVLVTTVASSVADLWEMGQDTYYSKYPSTASGLSLDNAVQYGGIRRMPRKQTCYLLHCTGDDGTTVKSGTVVASDTNPEKRLFAANDFVISRESFNSVLIRVAAVENNVYTLAINSAIYSYTNEDGTSEDILNGLLNAIDSNGYDVSITEDGYLSIADKAMSGNSLLELSENLTTHKVTTIASFFTEDYGKVVLPNGIITKIVTNVTGLDSVVNNVLPVYGRMQETDIELRQSYMAKSALRSNTMIDSIVGEILSNVADVESASGYENCENFEDERGLPPHSIEIVVEGGDENEIAEAIVRKKAGGIQTYGDVFVNVPGRYGDLLPTRFNRPEYLYTWLKITLTGNNSDMPGDYADLVKKSIMEFSTSLVAGTDLLIQLLNDGIYNTVAGVEFIDITVATSTDSNYIPTEDDYSRGNVKASTRQKVLLDDLRIEVTLNDDNV